MVRSKTPSQRLKLDLQSYAQGAAVVAQSIVVGQLQADVFLPITASPMRTVIQPLVFYAGTLKGAGNPADAAAFLDWLNREEAQALFRSAHFDPAGEATARINRDAPV
jgi:ABC-type molybdate transport system substrate-binding protein